MKRNLFYKISLGICIVAIIVLAVFLQKSIDEKSKLISNYNSNNIIGTYKYGTELSDASYLVFYENGKGIKYKQNQPSKELTYKKVDDYYILSTKEVVIVKNDSLIVVTNGTGTTYKKIDDIPTKINTAK